MPTITIDGQQIDAQPDDTVLRAATRAGLYIPHLCDSPGLEPYGACRMCIVEIDGMRGLPTSCSVRVADGMQIRSDVESVNSVRRMICEMLIADHPLVCLSCESNMQCKLQTVAAFLGIKESRLRRMVRKPIVDESNPFYKRDLSRCILCGLCTRACHELRGVGAIEIAGRGYASRVATVGDGPVSESVCVSCGECVDRCPVGALSAKDEAQPIREVKTTCIYCGVGCGLELGIRGGCIVRIRGEKDHVVNKGSLCVKGRFGLDFVGADDRLTHPLIKRNGTFEEATWEEAMALAAEKLGTIKAASGPDAIAGLSSAKCSNEENFLFQKMVRAGIGTNNVDHCARLCHASTVAGLARAFGSGAMTNSIDELEHADCILVTGSNTTEAHPVIALRIKAAVTRHGARLIVADPRRIDLVRFAVLHLRQRSGTDVALFNAMMSVILEEGLCDEEFIASRTEGFEEMKAGLESCRPESAARITGVPEDLIREAARSYATAKRASIVYSMGITQHTTGTDNVLALANLAMLTGNVGKESTGVNPLRGQNNVQGACDLGALPNVYPGYQKVDDDEVRRKFEKAWDVSPLPSSPGLTVVEIMHAAAEGAIKGLCIMGENPMLSDPNVNHVRDALSNLDFLCVQDIFLSETAQLADVVLPAASFAEKDGTFTNTERRVQRIRKALTPPGEARPDWEIICDLASRLGLNMQYSDPSEIMDEIASVTPIYGGISFDRIEDRGLQWPCPDKTHPGTRFLHGGEFKRGKGRFHATPFREAAEVPDKEYPYILTTGRYLEHFHTGTLSRRTAGLEKLSPPAPFEIHPEDAAREGIGDGDQVEVASRRGRVCARAVLTERSPRGTIFMPFHFREAAANVLTNDALDPVAKIPELKVCAVRLGKA